MKKRKMPNGIIEGGQMKIAVRFPPDTFKKICEMALKEDKSFSEMVSELCKVGILDLEESDQHEPKAA